MIAAWLSTFAATLIAVSAAMCGLALGNLLSRAPLRGSCGGPRGSCPCNPRHRPREALEEPT